MSQKKKPWFVMDVDDVLCDCSEAVRRMYNEKFGVNLQPAVHYNTIAAFPEIGEEGADWFATTYVHGETMGSLPVIPEAPAMAKEISKCFRIAYCTHRPDKIEKETKAWLEKYGFPKGSIYFNSGSKVNFRKEHSGPIVFIDDNAEYLNQVAASSNDPTLLLCVNMPHNKNVPLTEGAIRISDYKKIPIIAKRWKESIVDI